MSESTHAELGKGDLWRSGTLNRIKLWAAEFFFLANQLQSRKDREFRFDRVDSIEKLYILDNMYYRHLGQQ